MTLKSISLASHGLLCHAEEPPGRGPVSRKLLMQPHVEELIFLFRHSLEAIMSIASSKEGMSS